MDAGCTANECRVVHQLLMQRDIGVDAFHHHLGQRGAHAGDGLLTRVAVSDDLADHGIVIGRDEIVVVHMRIDADAGAAGHMPVGDASGRRYESVGVLGVDAAFDRMAAELDILLAERQFFAGRDADLLLHDVDAGDHFGDRMLDLHARVHFDEIELVVLVQELERARTAIIDLAAGFGTALADLVAQFGVEERSRRFFDDLLVTALHGAVAFAQEDRIAVLVGQHLDLDMARVLQEFLHVHHGIVEGGLRFGLGHGHRIEQRRFGMHHAHAASAAAARGLDDDRIADELGDAHDLGRIVRQARRPRRAPRARPLSSWRSWRKPCRPSGGWFRHAGR